jgi:hypothetical protein
MSDEFEPVRLREGVHALTVIKMAKAGSCSKLAQFRTKAKIDKPDFKFQHWRLDFAKHGQSWIIIELGNKDRKLISKTHTREQDSSSKLTEHF